MRRCISRANDFAGGQTAEADLKVTVAQLDSPQAWLMVAVSFVALFTSTASPTASALLQTNGA